jgi:hypothetical protein
MTDQEYQAWLHSETFELLSRLMDATAQRARDSMAGEISEPHEKNDAYGALRDHLVELRRAAAVLPTARARLAVGEGE